MRLETLQGLECARNVLLKPGMSTSKTAPLNGSRCWSMRNGSDPGMGTVETSRLERRLLGLELQKIKDDVMRETANMRNCPATEGSKKTAVMPWICVRNGP